MSAAIREADPEGLLELGAPDDEYDGQAAELARRLLHGDSMRETLDEWYPVGTGGSRRTSCTKPIPPDKLHETLVTIQRELLGT